jgi:predicted GIY-YIG superfamily endonuclease
MEPGVYILRCANGRYYIGSTNDIARRKNEHDEGRVLATTHLRPLELVLFQKYETLPIARRMEYKLKQLKRRDIIEKIIENQQITIRY